MAKDDDAAMARLRKTQLEFVFQEAAPGDLIAIPSEWSEQPKPRRRLGVVLTKKDDVITARIHGKSQQERLLRGKHSFDLPRVLLQRTKESFTTTSIYAKGKVSFVAKLSETRRVQLFDTFQRLLFDEQFEEALFVGNEALLLRINEMYTCVVSDKIAIITTTPGGGDVLEIVIRKGRVYTKSSGGEWTRAEDKILFLSGEEVDRDVQMYIAKSFRKCHNHNHSSTSTR